MAGGMENPPMAEAGMKTLTRVSAVLVITATMLVLFFGAFAWSKAGIKQVVMSQHGCQMTHWDVFAGGM